MKKIAFFVEGQTELYFINKLLIEIAGRKNVQIQLEKFYGSGSPKRIVVPKTQANASAPKYYALIYDCAGEENVKTQILEQIAGLIAQNYEEIIGLRDLYPLTDLAKLEDNLKNGVQLAGVQVIPPLPNEASIVVAVREVEDWFIAESNHFTCIHKDLQPAFIKSKLGIEPGVDDFSVRTTSAAEDLKEIYQLKGMTYKKDAKRVERTVECLDYANLYLNVRSKLPALDKLITKIDSFLT